MKKVFRFFGHPALVCASFLLFIVEGHHYGGFYVLYVRNALPHGAGYAVWGVAAVAMLMLGWILHFPFLRFGLYIAGITSIIVSLVLFFRTELILPPFFKFRGW